MFLIVYRWCTIVLFEFHSKVNILFQLETGKNIILWMDEQGVANTFINHIVFEELKEACSVQLSYPYCFAYITLTNLLRYKEFVHAMFSQALNNRWNLNLNNLLDNFCPIRKIFARY